MGNRRLLKAHVLLYPPSHGLEKQQPTEAQIE
jgi:hypothetical protein